MKKKKKYLPLYYEWMKSGHLPHNGLCNCFGIQYDESTWVPKQGFEDFRLMIPESKIRDYWGVEDEFYYHRYSHTLFTPLRQNIVLLMAAMNQEL